jgi:crossover junction endodeoxyribonuclease RuvC
VATTRPRIRSARMLIAGVDPGLDGALAFLDPATLRLVAMIGMPAMKIAKGKGSKREISARELVVQIEREVPVGLSLDVRVYIEWVHSSSQMGVTSAFQFGRGYGVVEGVIASFGWPIEYVTATKWKKSLRVPAEKDDARNRASQLMPRDAEHWTPQRLVMTKAQASGRAESALIALYGATRLPAGPTTPPELLAEAG